MDAPTPGWHQMFFFYDFYLSMQAPFLLISSFLTSRTPEILPYAKAWLPGPPAAEPKEGQEAGEDGTTQQKWTESTECM